MISFRNDYSEGAHPSVLEAISKHNFETTCGYSMDPFCHQAADTVRKLTACPDADVHFIVGGTLANTIVISAALRPWSAVTIRMSPSRIPGMKSATNLSNSVAAAA